MKKKNKRKPARANTWDPEKDSIFRSLVGVIQSHGYAVRREDLKQGHGWKAASGFCRLDQQKIIFVDRKLPQDEQITFLIQGISSAGLYPSEQQLESLPEKIREMLHACQPAAAAA
ncbi:MAG: hypothetical protein EBZ48_01880 [Proteobacteria bacterium]|nr:hypothetical protein [Pseudomonadota bacterium]